MKSYTVAFNILIFDLFFNILSYGKLVTIKYIGYNIEIFKLSI